MNRLCLLLLIACSQLFASELVIPVTEGQAVPDSFWQGRKKANANLCFVEERNDVSATIIAEGSPTHPKIWSGLMDSPTHRITWGVIWDDVYMSPDLRGNVYDGTWTKAPTPTAGDKKMLGANGLVKAGQYVGFEAWGDGAKVYTISAYNYDWEVGWLYFAIPEMPDYCLACLEERPIILKSDRDFNDVVLLINMGAANVQATLANQGFSPQVDPNSQLGQVLAPYLPVEPLSLGPVEPVFLAYGASVDMVVPVEGDVTGYEAEALPEATTFNLTSINSEPNAVIPSGKYQPKLRAWNKNKQVETITEIRINYPPVANAGLNENIVTGTVQLDGSASSDQDADQTLSFEWVQTEGPVVEISSPNQEVASCNLVKAGKYKFRVRCSDGMNFSEAEKTVEVAGNSTTLLVTEVEIRGTVASPSKVDVWVNDNPAISSQNSWKYLYPVQDVGQYVLNVQCKEKKTNKVLAEKLVTITIGDVYGQQATSTEARGKSMKPPVAPDDF